MFTTTDIQLQPYCIGMININVIYKKTVFIFSLIFVWIYMCRMYNNCLYMLIRWDTQMAKSFMEPQFAAQSCVPCVEASYDRYR